MSIAQGSLFVVATSGNEEEQRRIVLHNRAFEVSQPTPYATTWDVAIHGNDARAESMVRLRTLLYQQVKKCVQHRVERARFLQILVCEMRMKQSTTDAAHWVRKALLIFNYKG